MALAHQEQRRRSHWHGGQRRIISKLEGEGEVRLGEKENGGCYPEGSEGENGRRNTESFLIYVFKDAYFITGAKIESRHPPPT